MHGQDFVRVLATRAAGTAMDGACGPVRRGTQR